MCIEPNPKPVDPFDDLEALRLPPERQAGNARMIGAGEVSKPSPKERKSMGREFVPDYIRVPRFWRCALSGASRSATFKMANWLLNELFVEQARQKRGWRPKTARIRLIVANGNLSEIGGVSRREKARALAELEELGLIAVERRERKSPIIELLKLEELKAKA